MGVDFQAIFTHSYKLSEIIKLPAILNENKTLQQINDNTTDKWRWVDTDLELVFNRELFIDLVGPNDLDITFGKNLCVLYPGYRWKQFITNEHIQFKLRRICYELSHLFETPLYVPEIYECDGFVMDGKTMVDVKSYMYRRLGPPSPSIDVIIEKENEFEEFHGYEHGYLIDDFRDFKKG
ncbi:hypothetical protein VQL36_09505 [Chengkuizengella sp. SCS-71B]|uniref:hypothetical protein n=1 Tax=Chengkuizengella sp. SCS-71B TaxID=3115290 RepID=UPI0032C2204A